MEYFLQIVLVFFLVFLNGFFVASEFALISVRKTRIDELVRKKNATASMVQKALADLETYISATQLGITLASLALGWVGEPAIAHFLEPYFHFLPEQAALITSHTVSVIIAFATITVLHIVLGELAPKSIALQQAEKTSLFIIAPLTFFARVFKPAIWLLNGAGMLIIKLIGLKPLSGHQLVHSEEELRMLLDQSGQGGVLEKGEVEMVHNVFRLGDIPVKQIMVPRTDVIAFPASTTIKELVKKIQRHPHSRYPIYDESVDNVIGFVHVKDIYKLSLGNNTSKKVLQTNIIRQTMSVPEVRKADDVLLDMKKKRIHIAVVNDEYGGTAGVVSLEDVIESLVGEIQDEFDRPLHDIERQKDGSYLIDGLVTIERVQERFSLPLRGQGYMTIGGLLFGILGRQPLTHDSIQVGNIILEVAKIEKKRIATVRLSKMRKKKA